MIVFADYTRVCAYGPHGNMWTTREISWDGLHIDRFDGGQLFVIAWDAPNQRHVYATIALSTGVNPEVGPIPNGSGAAWFFDSRLFQTPFIVKLRSSANS